jgi:hypothetical protein
MDKPSVFVSYSHRDEREKDALLTQLKVLQMADLIDLWSDDRIGAGEHWKPEIEAAMEGAAVAILLVTANFLTSPFILGTEVPRVLRRRRDEGLIVFPVIARHCAWQTVDWLSEMNVVPKSGDPVWGKGRRNVDRELARIAVRVAEILARRQPPEPAAEEQPLRVTIQTPAGEGFQAETDPEVLVARLQADFLAEWQPPDRGAPVRYTLRTSPGASPLDPSRTLREAGLEDGADLYVVEEQLSPETAVGLMVEGPGGSRYTTAVRLNTEVRKLAEAFLATVGREGSAVVELLSGRRSPRVLRSEATLYDERVGDGGLLRISPV